MLSYTRSWDSLHFTKETKVCITVALIYKWHINVINSKNGVELNSIHTIGFEIYSNIVKQNNFNMFSSYGLNLRQIQLKSECCCFRSISSYRQNRTHISSSFSYTSRVSLRYQYNLLLNTTNLKLKLETTIKRIHHIPSNIVPFHMIFRKDKG